MAFAESRFAQFMSSGAGRLARIVAGVALIAWGISMGAIAGWVIVGVGVIPLVAGLMDVCFISALLGGPLAGRTIRAAVRRS